VTDGDAGDGSSTALARTVEALLHVASRPLTPLEIAGAAEVSPFEAEAALRQVAERHREGASGLVLERVAGGWCYRVAAEAAPAAVRLLERAVDRPLTAAATETLAVIAYAGPISRPEISRVRGVSSDGPVAGLLERGLIEEAGRADRPGAPVLYRTTTLFERVYGLEEGRDSLPSVEELGLPAGTTPAELRSRLEAAADVRADPLDAGGSSLEQPDRP
jgi:segregation and condensation protein B